MNSSNSPRGAGAGKSTTDPHADLVIVTSAGRCIRATSGNLALALTQHRDETTRNAKERADRRQHHLAAARDDRQAALNVLREIEDEQRHTLRIAVRLRKTRTLVPEPDAPHATIRPSARLPRQRAASGWLVDKAGMRGVHYQQSYISRRSPNFAPGCARRKFDYIIRDNAVITSADGRPLVFSNVGRDVIEMGDAWDVIETACTRKNAKVQIEAIVAFDADAALDEQVEALRAFLELTFEPLHIPYTAAMHAPSPEGDQRNVHAHILFNLRPTRRVGDREWEIADSVVRELDGKHGVTALRQLWAHAQTIAAEQSGRLVTYTALGHAARGLGVEPGEHLGPARMAQVRRGEEVPAHQRNLMRAQRSSLRARLADVERKQAALQRVAVAMEKRQAESRLPGPPMPRRQQYRPSAPAPARRARTWAAPDLGTVNSAKRIAMPPPAVRVVRHPLPPVACVQPRPIGPIAEMRVGSPHNEATTQAIKLMPASVTAALPIKQRLPSPGALVTGPLLHNTGPPTPFAGRLRTPEVASAKPFEMPTGVALPAARCSAFMSGLLLPVAPGRMAPEFLSLPLRRGHVVMPAGLLPSSPLHQLRLPALVSRNEAGTDLPSLLGLKAVTSSQLKSEINRAIPILSTVMHPAARGRLTTALPPSPLVPLLEPQLRSPPWRPAIQAATFIAPPVALSLRAKVPSAPKAIRPDTLGDTRRDQLLSILFELGLLFDAAAEEHAKREREREEKERKREAAARVPVPAPVQLPSPPVQHAPMATSAAVPHATDRPAHIVSNTHKLNIPAFGEFVGMTHQFKEMLYVLARQPDLAVMANDGKLTIPPDKRQTVQARQLAFFMDSWREDPNSHAMMLQCWSGGLAGDKDPWPEGYHDVLVAFARDADAEARRLKERLQSKGARGRGLERGMEW